MDWSDYQLAVFDNVANGSGHTVVNAVAGSGKTTTIQEATNHVPRGLKTLFVAFNKAIATELGKRLQGRPVEVSTLHSYGLKCITANLGRLQIDDQRIELLLNEKKIEGLQLRRDLVKVLSLAKGSLASTPERVDAIIDAFNIQSVREIEEETEDPENSEGIRVWFIQTILELLDRCRSTQEGKIDFDDMVWLPVVLNLRQRKFDRVFVDETQDLNAAQIELTLRACKPGGRIMAVGDPRQAIYRFRGADENAFQNVKDRLQATELPLSVCYRCSVAVLDEARKIVPKIEAAPDAVEGEVVRKTFDQMVAEAMPGDFVLSRTNAPLIQLCMAFLIADRPASVQGRDVGASLAALVRRSRATTVVELRNYVEAWADKECERLAKKRRDTQLVEDKKSCIFALSEGLETTQDVLTRIEKLFSDTASENRIILSTTHKAKGLERDRVWMLAETYRKRDTIEESNLAYVAITRARKTLFIVR